MAAKTKGQARYEERVMAEDTLVIGTFKQIIGVLGALGGLYLFLVGVFLLGLVVVGISGTLIAVTEREIRRIPQETMDQL